MTPHAIWIREEDVLAEAAKQAKALGKAPEAYLIEKTRLGVRLALGMDCDLTVREAAAYMGCSRGTIINWHNQGKLPSAYYQSPKFLRVPKRDLDRLKEATVEIKEAARKVA